MKNLLLLGGQGKLGRAVKDLASEYHVTSIGRGEDLRGALDACDIAVVCVPGVSLPEILPALRDSKRPAVIASTGYDFDEKPQDGVTWLLGANFAANMQPIRQHLQNLRSQIAKGRGIASIDMTETHDITKKDSPSGTALLWQRWVGVDFDIEALRIAGAMPTHELRINWADGEQEVVTHQAESRAIYAEGILWSVGQILDGHAPQAGIVWFEDVWDEAHRD